MGKNKKNTDDTIKDNKSDELCNTLSDVKSLASSISLNEEDDVLDLYEIDNNNISRLSLSDLYALLNIAKELFVDEVNYHVSVGSKPKGVSFREIHTQIKNECKIRLENITFE